MAVFERLMPGIGDCVLERYELVAELGRGGFGVVFRAVQRGLNNEVAIKVLLPHILSNEDLLRRFEREVEVCKGLHHHNTIRILDCGRTEQNLPFYAMEFVRGEPLDEVLRGGALSAVRTRRIVLQILKSLGEAHVRGVIHRDLKPANIMLSQVFGESDFVKVLDFGIAKALSDDDPSVETKTGQVIGTPYYVSPEQARGSKHLDNRSDIYSVGLIMAECIGGQRVVHDGSSFEILAQHALPQPLAFTDAVTASPLWPIIDCATRKNRDERFPDAVEMSRALASIANLSDEPIDVAASSVDMHQPIPSSLLERRTPVPGYAYGNTPVSNNAQTMQSAPRRTSIAPLLLIGLIALVGGAGAVVIINGGGGSADGSRGGAAGGGGGSDTPSLTQGQDDAAEPNDPGTEAGADGAQAQGGVALGEGSTDTDSGSDQVAIGPAAEGDGSTGAAPEHGEMGAASGTTEGTSTAGGGWVQSTASAIGTSRIDPALLNDMIGLTQARVHRALPRAATFRFEGTRRAEVHLDAHILGEIPFEIEHPLLDAELVLQARRHGYETEDMTVSLLSPSVSIELSRTESSSQTDGQTPTESGGDDEDDGQGEINPFEATPIYR